ncbi:hypothetical protein ASE01_12925 [Nocardioides sp. Root190]|uniref:GNAT family N-acetyltransferase n=1 Tax=Nocardioides sp. Root190 TaxID=1736488 RepID=UPI0006F6057B|nr:GNAT family N-acetyltransferase [Nocardioides sp. Root190]KRB75948.1 hypothetical protein ASE01_12925 [Nocardioides sp. Root190]
MVVDLTLRPATSADAAAVALVHLRARAAAPMPPPVHTDTEVASWLASRIGGAGGDEVWVALRGETLIGYVRFTRTWLDDLYVDPDHAGRGVGTALLDLAKARHPRGFGLWVFESNTPAYAFYLASGLVERDRTDGSANEERAPDIRMEWPGA